MITREALKKQKVNFERLTGVKLSSSKEIVEKVRPSWEEVQELKKSIRPKIAFKNSGGRGIAYVDILQILHSSRIFMVSL
jgi:hypothetical protein